MEQDWSDEFGGNFNRLNPGDVSQETTVFANSIHNEKRAHRARTSSASVRKEADLGLPSAPSHTPGTAAGGGGDGGGRSGGRVDLNLDLPSVPTHVPGGTGVATGVMMVEC